MDYSEVKKLHCQHLSSLDKKQWTASAGSGWVWRSFCHCILEWLYSWNDSSLWSFCGFPIKSPSIEWWQCEYIILLFCFPFTPRFISSLIAMPFVTLNCDNGETNQWEMIDNSIKKRGEKRQKRSIENSFVLFFIWFCQKENGKLGLLKCRIGNFL